MAIEDTPIDQEVEETVQDNPVEIEEKSPYSKSAEELAAIQSSFIDNYLTGSPVADNFLKYSASPDKIGDAENLAKQKAQQDSEDVLEEFVHNPYGGTGSVETASEAIREALRAIEQDTLDVDQHYTESAMGPDSLLEDAKREAGRIKMAEMLGAWQEDIGTSDVGMELGKVFLVPFLESIRGAKVTGEYFGAKEEFQAMVRAFKMQPIEDQVKMLPHLKEELESKVGDVQTINLLTSFLDPHGAEDFDRFGGEEIAWDILDATGVGYVLGAVLKGTKKSINTVSTLNQLKNFEASEAAATLAVIDPEIAKAMNLDPVNSVANAMPFDTSIEAIGRTGGMSNKVLDNLEKFFGEADTTALKIINADGFMREQFISNSHRLRLEDAAAKKLQAEKAENIKPISREGNQTTFEYQILDEDGNLTDKTYTLSLSLDDAGMYEQSTIGLIREYIGSPTAFARGMLLEDVKTAQRLDFLQTKINRQLTDLTKDALRPIGLVPTPKNKASLARVDKATREGDEWKNADDTRGKVFSPDELRTKFGFESENEISAYYRVNRLYNNLWHIRNNEKRLEYSTLGYKGVNFTRSGDGAIGKSYETALTARAALNKDSIHYVYDADTDNLIDLRNVDTDYISSAYADNGKVLVKIDNGYDIGENRGLYEFALVPKADVGQLPQQVIPRKVGYAPRIYENASHFVKERKTRTINGDKETHPKETLRFFDNKREANIFAKQKADAYLATKIDELAKKNLGPEQRQLQEDKILKEAEERFIVLTDREEEILSAGVGEISHGNSGLYVGARSGDALLFGLNGDKAIRVNSFEALIRNISNLSRYTSINQWRLGLEQRWINTANEIFKAKGIETRMERFERLPKTSESSPEVRFLNRIHDQIRDWQSFPTAEEQFFSNLVRGLYDNAADRNYKRTAKMLGNFKDVDPIAAARATSFHALLGMLNPAHMWIQAQGAAVAISLGFGKYLTQTLRNTTALTLLGYGAVDKARYVRTAKGTLWDADELEATHKLWLKTGYEDSVLQTADHAAASKGYGMTLAAIKKAADLGLLFYRQGEFFNRRMAFTTAIERWKEANNVDSIKGISDNVLKTIVDDSNNILLNMSKANRAPWQKGLMSLPTQYSQITTKTIETVTGLNESFTRGDRARIMAGQLVLYGTAGIPLAGLGYMLATEVFGMTQQDIENNPALFKTINDGFWGTTAYLLFDADIELSDRGSLLRGISTFVDNWMLQESTLAEKFLGAFGSTGQRFFDDLAYRIRPMSLGSIGELDWSDLGNFLIDNPALRTLSSYNNLDKALIMQRLDAAYARSGQKIASGFNGWEAIAQGIGFQPTKVTDTWDIMARTRAMKELPKKIQADVLRHMNEFAAKFPDGGYTDEDFAKHEKGIQAYMAILDPDQQLDLIKNIHRLYTGDDQRTRAIAAYIDIMVDNTATDRSNWRTTALGTKAIRLGITEEQE